MEIDHVAGQASPLVSGLVLQQAGTGSFSDSSFNGVSVFETTALGASAGTALGQVGLLTADGSGNLTSYFDQSAGGATQSNVGTYSVGSNGRATLTNSRVASSEPVLYFVSPNQAFLIGTDAAVTFGFMKSQSGPFTAASLSGTYAGGSLATVLSGGTNQLDIASADGVSGLTFYTDRTSTGGLLQNQTSSATYSVTSNGRGVVTQSPSSVFYMVSPSEFWLLAVDPSATVEIFQQ
jgi:hypothetical protein